MDSNINGESFNGEVIMSDITNESVHFDSSIGHIEDILLDPNFQSLLSSFMDQHCMEFDDSEENKLIYTDIFQQYVLLIESTMEQELKQRIPGFDMTNFLNDIPSNGGEVEGEVFEILRSFTDFLSFKELMLDYKAAKNGNNVALSIGMSI